MKIKNMTAKEILEEVERIENKIMDEDELSFEYGEGYEMFSDAYYLMKKFIENLHPGTRTL